MVYRIVGNFRENPVSPPEEIFVVLILRLAWAIDHASYRSRANRGEDVPWERVGRCLPV